MEPLEVDDARIDAALAQLAVEGFSPLGRVADPAVLETLRSRADDIMEGRIVHEGLFFQLDAATGRYEDLPYGRGYEGPSLRYRKIEKLERDSIFRSWLENSVFERIAHRVLGDEVFLLRAMLMTKPPESATPLPWHQDAGLFWGVSPAPRLQLWTALDDAPVAAGCLEVLPRSHTDGLATAQGGVVPAEIVARTGADARAVSLPARAGDVILLHNLTWHRSGANTTACPRRAFSVCFIDAATRCTRTRRAPRQFERMFERGRE
jgi:hypothetical protein